MLDHTALENLILSNVNQIFDISMVNFFLKKRQTFLYNHIRLTSFIYAYENKFRPHHIPRATRISKHLGCENGEKKPPPKTTDTAKMRICRREWDSEGRCWNRYNGRKVRGKAQTVQSPGTSFLDDAEIRFRNSWDPSSTVSSPLTTQKRGGK